MQTIENYCASTTYRTGTPSPTCVAAGTPSSSACKIGTYKRGTGMWMPATPSGPSRCITATKVENKCMKNNVEVGSPNPLYYCH